MIPFQFLTWSTSWEQQLPIIIFMMETQNFSMNIFNSHVQTKFRKTFVSSPSNGNLKSFGVYWTRHRDFPLSFHRISIFNVFPSSTPLFFLLIHLWPNPSLLLNISSPHFFPHDVCQVFLNFRIFLHFLHFPQWEFHLCYRMSWSCSVLSL